jgi:predicted alpha/beta hydrolase family esterase
VTTAAFLILHGLDNYRPQGHWQHWLARELAAVGATVLYPQLPEPTRPVLADWLAALTDNLDRLAAAGADEVVVVAHSLGCTLWSRAAERGLVLDGLVDRVLLVAAPSPIALAPIDGLADFTHRPGPALDRVAGATWAVTSDDDPFCPEGVHGLMPELPAHRRIELSAQGHLTIADGYGPWPSLLAWCLNPTTALVPAR